MNEKVIPLQICKVYKPGRQTPEIFTDSKMELGWNDRNETPQYDGNVPVDSYLLTI